MSISKLGIPCLKFQCIFELRGRNWNVFWVKYILSPRESSVKDLGFGYISKGIFRDNTLREKD